MAGERLSSTAAACAATRARRLKRSFDIDLPVDALIRDLSTAEQQVVQITRALLQPSEFARVRRADRGARPARGGAPVLDDRTFARRRSDRALHLPLPERDRASLRPRDRAAQRRRCRDRLDARHDHRDPRVADDRPQDGRHVSKPQAASRRACARDRVAGARGRIRRRLGCPAARRNSRRHRPCRVGRQGLRPRLVRRRKTDGRPHRGRRRSRCAPARPPQRSRAASRSFPRIAGRTASRSISPSARTRRSPSLKVFSRFGFLDAAQGTPGGR